MRQFKTYPIYINHNINSAATDTLRRQRDQFVDKGDYKMMDWLDTTGKRIYEIKEAGRNGYGSLQTIESKAYEAAVYALLESINRTSIGRLLLDSLNTNQKFWIVPLDKEDSSYCQCSAFVFPGHPKEGAGVRIYYNPSDFQRGRQEDVLFHELVHAYRNGRVGYAGENHRQLREYKTAEEFIAMHLQNVFLACKGFMKFHRSHSVLTMLSKKEIYDYFASDLEAFNTLQYYRNTEPFTEKVAKLREPIFNPWRDFPNIEKVFRSKYPALNFIPTILW